MIAVSFMKDAKKYMGSLEDSAKEKSEKQLENYPDSQYNLTKGRVKKLHGSCSKLCTHLRGEQQATQ